MQTNRAIEISKFLSDLWGHQPQAIGLHLEEYGWAKVSDIVEIPFSFEEFNDVVDHHDKKRFSFHENLTLIKANQGHSIDISLELRTVTPPEILSHGTYPTALKSIQPQELKKGLEQFD